MNWTEIRARWSAGWKSAWDKAQETWAQLVRRDPQRYREQVAETVTALQQVQDLLQGMIPKLPRSIDTDTGRWAHRNFELLKARYENLAAGIFAETERPTFGAVPVVLVVAGVALTIPATCWALARRQEAQNLLEQTRLFARELDARVQAMQGGLVLQEPTLSARHLPGPRNLARAAAAPMDGVAPWLPVLGATALIGGMWLVAGRRKAS